MDKFIAKCFNKFGHKYNYDGIIYNGSKIKINIKCNKHDLIFSQTPAEHLRGKITCIKCREENNKTIKKESKGRKFDNNMFISKSTETHGKKYNYEFVDYKDSKTKVKIECPIHGIFEQLPSGHIRGKGCLKCGKESSKKTLTSNTLDFISKSVETHGKKYNYEFVEYKNAKTKVNIECPKHGIFEQLPNDHLTNHGCPNCTSSVSSYENEINEFLVSLGVKTITSSRSVISPKQLDIFIPDVNLAIEFNGLYWHNETRIDKNYHLEKTIDCQKNNIKLIHIFEDEWLFKKEIVKSRLTNILGLTKNKIYGRKTIVKEITSKDAKFFLDNTHLQGHTNASINLGLFYDDELVSVMLFNKPRLGIGTKYEGFELSRFANKLNFSVIGGADKLLKYFITNYQPKQLISYADRRWSDGGLYKKLGFKETRINKPNYWYIIGKHRKHRFNYRKSLLKKDGYEVVDKTEHEIMLERKIYRIYDCGTITYNMILS